MKRARSGVALLGLASGLWLPTLAAHASEPRDVVARPLVTTSGAPLVAGDVSFSVILHPSHLDALTTLVADLSNPSSRNYRHFLPRGRFAALFGPSTAAIGAVRDYFAGFHLQVSHPIDGGLLMTIHGDARDASRALDATLRRVRRQGLTLSVTSGPASVPASVGHYIAAVTGISGEHPHHRVISHATALPTAGCGGAQSAITSHQAFSPLAQAAGYGLSAQWAAGNTGAGQNIALYELAAYQNNDITAYANCFGLTPSISSVSVDGGAGAFDSTTGSEPTLDLQELIALSPGAHVVVYSGPNNNVGPTDVYAKIASDDLASIVSTSWGICESGLDQSAEAPLFDQMVAQGQSVFASSGDSGSADCYDPTMPGSTSQLAVDDPAAQPTVTGVGGLTISSFSPLRASVWNEGGGTVGASGGGFSQTYATPTWQLGALRASGALALSPTTCGPAQNQSCRAVPDLSVMGDPNTGFLSRYQGAWGGVGGTSIGSPLVASVVAVAAQNCGVTTGFGNLNPQLYQMTTGGGGLIDITTGNNSVLGLGAYSATAGYDPASGLGTIDPSSFYNAICPLAVSPSLSAVSIPASLSVHGLAGSITVTARTMRNALITTATPVVSVSPSTGLTLGPVVSTGVGRSTIAVSATQVGSYQVSVTVAGRVIATTTLNVTGPIAVPGTSTLTASSAVTTVDGAPDIIRVVARASDGTVVSGVTPSLSVFPPTGLSLAVSTASDVTTAAVTATQAGSYTVTATVGDVTIGSVTVIVTSPFSPTALTSGVPGALSNFLPAVDALSSNGTLYLAGHGAAGHIYLASATGTTRDLTATHVLPANSANPALSCVVTCAVAENVAGAVVADVAALGSGKLVTVTNYAKLPSRAVGSPTITAIPASTNWLVTWRSTTNHLLAAIITAGGDIAEVRDISAGLRGPALTATPSALVVGSRIVVATRSANTYLLYSWSGSSWKQVIVGSTTTSSAAAPVMFAVAGQLTVAYPTATSVALYSVAVTTSVVTSRGTVATAIPTHFTSGVVALVAGSADVDVVTMQSGSLVVWSGPTLTFSQPLANLLGANGPLSVAATGSQLALSTGSGILLL